jgi:hypothetical protein
MHTSKQFKNTAKFIEIKKSHIYKHIVCTSFEAITEYESADNMLLERKRILYLCVKFFAIYRFIAR